MSTVEMTGDISLGSVSNKSIGDYVNRESVLHRSIFDMVVQYRVAKQTKPNTAHKYSIFKAIVKASMDDLNLAIRIITA